MCQLASYGGSLHYTIMFTLDESAPVQHHLAEADVILQVMALFYCTRLVWYFTWTS